ncbi:MAG TPA: oligosaccharide flippase family protein [Lapillicoccus sp.]|nr:oligosaccharide flippase family protein [Lapillicoccus sp.]
MTEGLGRNVGDEPEPPDGPVLRRGELQDRAMRGVTWTMVHTVVSLPIAFLVNLVVARVLGVVDYGRLAFLTVVLDIAAGVVLLGVNPALVQFGSKAHALGRRHDVTDLLSKVQGFRLFFTAPLLAVVVVVLVSDVGIWFKVIAVVFGVLLPAALDGAPACLGIENKTAAGAKVALVSNVIVQGLVLAAVLTIAQADVVWAVRLIAVGATTALALIPISRAYRRAVLRPAFPRGFPPGFWKFAIPTGLAYLLSSLVVSRTEVVALTWLSDPASVGLFALAFGLAGHMYAPAQALIGPLVPAISGLREVDTSAVTEAFRRTLRGSSTAVSMLSGIALPVIAVLATTFYGSTYAGVEPVLLALGIANGFFVVGGPVSAFVMARLSASRVLIASVVALAVDVALALSLIPLWGVWGAVVANVAAAGTQMMVLLVSELRALHLSWSVVSRDALPALVGALSAVLAWYLSSRASSVALAAVVAAVVGLVSVGGGLWALRSGLTADDGRAVLRVLPARVQALAGPLLRCVQWRRTSEATGPEPTR